MGDNIPYFDTLGDIYDTASLGKQGQRYNTLVEQFALRYGCMPDFVARSPGRVNLIGEHIDYCGFGVLPMAIERDVIMAVASVDDDSRVVLANTNPRFEAREFAYEGKDAIVTIDATQHEWSNYFKCGYKGILKRAPELDKPKGMRVLMDGTVPTGSGLSSSAAFVCTSALAVMIANKLPWSKQTLAEIAIVAERNVGVNSGGMDQTASVFGQKDFALHVDFVPKLSARPVRLPDTQPGLAFVIANTLVTADKVVTAPKNYNLRVVETRMAALFLSKALNLPQKTDSLKQVFDTYFEGSDESELAKFDAFIERVTELFPEDSTGGNGFTLEQVTEMVGVSSKELQDEYMTRFPIQTDYFRLRQRTLHVLAEARRVVAFEAVCKQAPANALEVLGQMMNDSQTSCSTLFNCSCPEIETICDIARRHGAYGARLTGAGWGGCTVMLTTVDNVAKLITAVKDNYHRAKFPELSEEELDDAVLATQPCSGAAVFVGFEGSAH